MKRFIQLLLTPGIRAARKAQILTTLLMAMALGACASNQTDKTLYDDLGGQPTIDRIADEFIVEIAYDDRVFPRFADSNVQRFREKIIEHFCMIANGPCVYTGDSMVQTHAGMNISEAEFNAVVEDLIAAMDTVGVDIGTQNRLLARLATLRPQIVGI
ncbi:MAG: group 1 truncated hemoglobin [Pseudomonadota bacterium]|nr:group 1 truncated hemoglobin [Gammaproteobacteria bacterium]MBJ55978.1 group 1 truncated hemoglobin [Gammaproteobacteria bacterium]MEC8860963.1 group 1 truncated hemoglobin [Pseudomonadota bacterium]|tara:strand:- start:657 stop:1130 length:474 start_codon:yes stop_codon:yes gene_type:complete